MVDIRNPKFLRADGRRFQAERGQTAFRHAEIREMRQIAFHRLKPAVGGENFSHFRVGELFDIEREQEIMLRSAGRGDRKEN